MQGISIQSHGGTIHHSIQGECCVPYHSCNIFADKSWLALNFSINSCHHVMATQLPNIPTSCHYFNPDPVSLIIVFTCLVIPQSCASPFMHTSHFLHPHYP